MATLLDPRFKSAGFSKRQNATVAKELLISELLDRHRHSQDQQNIDIEITGSPEEHDVATAAVVTNASQEWAAILESESQSEDDGDELADVETRLRREVTEYLKEPRIAISEDLLMYWKENAVKWPSLGSIARKYHSAPPSSAAPERLFSTAKHVLKPTRLRLLPTNVEASLFLKKNLVAFPGSDHQKAPPPDDFTEPNSLGCPSAVLGEDATDSEGSDIEISSEEDE